MRNHADELERLENHVADRIILTFLAIQDSLDNQFGRIINTRNDARAEGTEGIETLGASALRKGRVLLDQLTCGNVIGAGVAENIVRRIGFRKLPCSVCRSRYPIHLHRQPCRHRNSVF